MKRELLIQLLCEHYGLHRREFDPLTDKELEDQFQMIRDKLFGDY